MRADRRSQAQRTHRLDTTYDAVLFDLDGVVTNTAAIHAAARKQLFDEVLRDPRVHVDDPQNTFDPVADYRRYVDGRTREDGVARYLAARGVRLDAGQSNDPPSAWTTAGIAARKNALFLAELRTRGLRVYPGTAALLRRLRDAAIPAGLVTASRNAQQLLDTAGLTGAFDTVVDGQTALTHHLQGKPYPDMFAEAARRLGVPPARIAIVEDSVAGVEAGQRGGFGLVVGIDRAEQREQLEAAGADIVLNDVGELDLGLSTTDPWQLDRVGTADLLRAAGEVTLPTRGPDRQISIALTGSMAAYDWGVDGRRFDMRDPLRGAHEIRQGERVRLTIDNQTTMWHPFHLHGHTYQHQDGGPRKDTSIILPKQTLTVDFDADNPGLWVAHCHNIYHAETGMTTVIGYRA